MTLFGCKDTEKWRSVQTKRHFLYNINDMFLLKHAYFIIEMWLKMSASTITPAVNITIVSIILQSFYRCSYTLGDASPCFPRTLFDLHFILLSYH